jgi:hypothetical protein
MTLLLCILESPDNPDVDADAQLLGEFVRQVKRVQNEGDFPSQISNLLRACLGLEKLGSVAIGQNKNDERPGVGAEPSPGTVPHGTAEVRPLTRRLGSTIH